MHNKNRVLALTLLMSLALMGCGQEQDFEPPTGFTDESRSSTTTEVIAVPEDHATTASVEDDADVDDSSSTTTTTVLVEPSPQSETKTIDGGGDEPIDTPEPTQVASTPEFCDASAEYYTSTEAGDYVSLRNQSAIRALFEEMDERVIRAIDVAPNDELAEPAIAAHHHLANVHDGIASVGYDGAAFEESLVFSDLAPDFDALAAINGLLEQFLEGECGRSLRQLRVDGSLLGEKLVAESKTDRPVDYVLAMDAAARIKVDVPSTWTDVLNQPTGETAVMIASPDASLFDSSWAVDGLRISTSPAGSAVDIESAMAQSPAAIECRMVSRDAYDDGHYVGTMENYRGCGESTVATVIGAVSTAGDYSVLVELQFDNVDTTSDSQTLQRVIDTFLVR